MNIRPCPPGEVFHYHAATALIHGVICFLINDHAAQQQSTQDKDLQQIIRATSAGTGINGKPESNPSRGASYLCASVVVFVSVAALLKDPLSAQPCSPLWACICGADQRRLWKRRDQGSESPPSEQPRLVHFPVSPTLRGHSSQPISTAESGSERSGRGEVLRGLSRTWKSERSTSSYMSHCSQRTCH